MSESCLMVNASSQARSVVQQAVDKSQESSEDDWEDKDWENTDAVPAFGSAAEQAKQKVRGLKRWGVEWRGGGNPCSPPVPSLFTAVAALLFLLRSNRRRVAL